MLETDRLLLRAMVPEDIDPLLEVFGDPKVMESFNEPPFNREQMAGWVERNLKHQEKHGYGLFSVVLKSEGKLIGDCGLEHMELGGEQVVELGYDIASQYWNQGIATEAASAVRDHAFTELGLKEIVSFIRDHNIASRRVSEKIGMTLERKLGKPGHVHFIYSIAKSDA